MFVFRQNPQIHKHTLIYKMEQKCKIIVSWTCQGKKQAIYYLMLNLAWNIGFLYRERGEEGVQFLGFNATAFFLEDPFFWFKHTESQHLSHFYTKLWGRSCQNKTTDFRTEKFSFCLLMLYFFSMKFHGKRISYMHTVLIFIVVYSLVVQTFGCHVILTFSLKPMKVCEVLKGKICVRLL